MFNGILSHRLINHTHLGESIAYFLRLIPGHAFAWYTLSHQKLTMEATISALTRQYWDACERNGHLSDSFWKRGLTFLTTHTHQQMHQYNLKHGATPKLPPNDPPVQTPPHLSPPQQHQQPPPTRKSMAVSTPQPSIHTLGSTSEIPSTTTQQENLQEILSVFDNLRTSQHIDHPYPQVTNTQKGV